jgi:hypothetical protein
MNDDVVVEGDDLQTHAIGFNSSVAKNPMTTRTLSSVDDLTKFFVYGTQDGTTDLFLAQEVVKANGDWTYTYNQGSSKPKWTPGSRYVFYAYSSDNAALNGTAVYNVTDGLTFEGVTSGTATTNADLVYASKVEQVGLQSGNNRVAFNFKHILSQINVVFKNATSNAENIAYTAVVDSISLSGYSLTGDFDGSAWTIASSSSAADNVALGFSGNAATTGSLALAATEQTLPLYVLPQQTSDIELVFRATITNANNASDKVVKTWKATFDAAWELGYRYVYNIPLSLVADEYIEFTANSLNGWSEGTTGTIKLVEVK